MRIAYCTALFPCRSEQFLLREISCLQGRGVDVTVLALKGPNAEACCAAPALPVAYRPSRASLEAWRSMLWLVACRPVQLCLLLGECLRLAMSSPRLAISLVANLHAIAFFARQVADRQITLVYGYFLNLPGLVAMGVSIVAGVPFAVGGHARDVFVEGAAARVLARRARHLIVCNASAAAALRASLPEVQRAKVLLLHHGVKLPAKNQQRSRGRPQSPVVVAIGRFVPKKGFTCLIRATALLRERGTAVQLILVGEGPESSALRQLAEELHVLDQISWPGWLDEGQIRGVLRDASALVVPSIVSRDGDRDGIPNVLLEAWAAGTPVVASDLPSMREAIRHECEGLLFESSNEHALAAAIARLLSDADLQRKLIEHGKRRLHEEFDIRTNGEKLLSLLVASQSV